jgi:hypothetical protein
MFQRRQPQRSRSPLYSRHSSGGWRHLRRLALGLALLGAGLAFCAYLPADRAVSTASAEPQAPTVPPAGGQAAPTAPSQLDEPLRLVVAAAQSYQQVRDYSCTLIKQERIKGVLPPENVILMKFRQQPFSVYMRWSAPKEFVGQEVCYVHGKNNNMMRVHSPVGLGKLVGFVSISPRDPRALEHSKHTITEAGIGNLIGQIYQEWTRVRQRAKVVVRIAEYQYDRKPCSRVEVIYQEKGPQDYCCRVVVYFDKQNHLPVRMECYDWPRAGGPPDGDLLESFSYANLQLNVGINDAHFNY